MRGDKDAAAPGDCDARRRGRRHEMEPRPGCLPPHGSSPAPRGTAVGPGTRPRVAGQLGKQGAVRLHSREDGLEPLPFLCETNKTAPFAARTPGGTAAGRGRKCQRREHRPRGEASPALRALTGEFVLFSWSFRICTTRGRSCDPPTGRIAEPGECSSHGITHNRGSPEGGQAGAGPATGVCVRRQGSGWHREPRHSVSVAPPGCEFPLAPLVSTCPSAFPGCQGIPK